MRSLILVAMSSCLVLGFLLSMVVTGLLVAALFMGVSSLAFAVALHATRGMYLHAERLLAKAGVARRNGEGYLPPLKRRRSWSGKGEAQRRSAQAKRGRLWETPCAARSGQSP